LQCQIRKLRTGKVKKIPFVNKDKLGRENIIMKYVDIDKLDEFPGKRLEDGDTFQFQCHSKLDCFNLCCRNLNLFLYPYDVVRLKKKLGISSDEFLDKYVDVVLRESSFFPEVLLHMSEDEEKTCPFLTKSGCTVYSDRPDACRMFPVEQGALYDSETKKAKAKKKNGQLKHGKMIKTLFCIIR